MWLQIALVLLGGVCWFVGLTYAVPIVFVVVLRVRQRQRKGGPLRGST